jgi:lysophospholipase L1-like esterase
VINAGYPMMHTGQELALLRKFGLQYQPDLVVLGFFVGNDFYDADPDRLRVVVGGVATDVRPKQEFYRVVLGQPLVWRSRLLLFARERWNELRLVDEAERKQLVAPPAVDRVLGVPAPAAERARARKTTADAYFRWLERRMDFTRRSESASFRRNEAYIRQSLREMRDLLAARGIPLVVAAYPDAVQVDPAIRQTLLERSGRDGSEYEWRRAQRLLAGFCAQLGIPFEDLLPAFVGAQRQGWNLYLVDDSHWSKAGNVLAAELLSRALAPEIGPACAKMRSATLEGSER